MSALGVRPVRRALCALTASLLCTLGAVSAAQAQSVFERVQNVCYFPLRGLSSNARACVSDAGCKRDQRCRLGFCQLRPGVYRAEEAGVTPQDPDPQHGEKFPELVAPPVPVAEQECQQDRRCRLNRLKRQNNARRYVSTLRAEETAFQFQSTHEQEIANAIVRQASPIHADLTYSFLGIGLGAGYTVGGRLRLEGGFQYLSTYIDTTIEELNGTYFSSDMEAYFYSFGATYLLRESWWTPYISGGFTYGSGGFGYGYYDDFGGGSSNLSLTMHILSASAGMDFQTSFGMRGRLGVVTRLPIYTRVASAPGVYDETYKAGVNAYFASDQRIGPEISIGWAF